MSFKEEFSKAFGNLANVFGDAAKATADKTKQMSEIAKLNLKIKTEEDKIKKAQAELGKLYYNDFEAGLPIESENYLPVCNQIRDAKEAIAQYRASIEELKAAKPEEAVVEEKAVVEAEPCCCACEEAPAAEEVAAESIEFTVVDDVQSEQADEEKPCDCAE